MAKKSDFVALQELITSTADKTVERLVEYVQEEGAAIRKEIRGEINSLEQKINEGFSRIDRRLDETIQVQLDEHAGRIRVLEDKALPR